MQGRIADIQNSLSWMTERMSASGDVALYTNSQELIRAIARVTRYALAREQVSREILRVSALSGYRIGERDPLLAQEVVAWRNAMEPYLLLPGSPSDSKTR